MDEKKIEVSIERFEELLRKEIVYQIERAKLLGSSYISIEDRVLYGIEERAVE